MADDSLSESFEHRGLTIEIHYDPEPLNPRREYEHETTMALFHRNYDLGDENHGIDSEDFDGWEEMSLHIEKKLKAVVILPVYLIDHSGLAVRSGPFFEDPGGWDSGVVGFIFQTAKGIREQWMLPRNKKLTDEQIAAALNGLEIEIGEYNDYLSGNCYGYVIEDADGDHLESCWGFLGDDTYCKAEAISMADAIADRRDKKQATEDAMSQLPVALNAGDDEE